MTKSRSSDFLGNISFFDEIYEYSINPKCIICSATNHAGDSKRPKIDKMIVAWLQTGKMYQSDALAKKVLRTIGKKSGLARQGLTNHVQKHSPYIIEIRDKLRKMVDDEVNKEVEILEKKHYEAEEIIQKIIDKTGEALDNDELEITEKLALGALKEQGVRQKYGTLNQMLAAMDQDRFLVGNNAKQLQEGEVIDEHTKSEESTADIQR